MPYLKLKQLQFEHDTWKRLLGFMMDENDRMKSRLKEVLTNSGNDGVPEEPARFQNEFMKEDELIRSLYHDVFESEQMLVKEIFDNDHSLNKIENGLCALRNNITDAEIQFGDLKFSFNQYLSENYR